MFSVVHAYPIIALMSEMLIVIFCLILYRVNLDLLGPLDLL